MVSADHPFLDPRQLEAEATGLLDRMLSVLQDNSRYDIDFDCVAREIRLTKHPVLAMLL